MPLYLGVLTYGTRLMQHCKNSTSKIQIPWLSIQGLLPSGLAYLFRYPGPSKTKLFYHCPPNSTFSHFKILSNPQGPSQG